MEGGVEVPGETSREIELVQARSGNDSENVQNDPIERRCRICLETFPEKSENSNSEGQTKAESSDSKGKTKAEGSEAECSNFKGEVIDLGEENSTSKKGKAERADSQGEVIELGCKCKDVGKMHRHCALKWFKDTKHDLQCEVCKGTVQNLDHMVVSPISLVSTPPRASPPPLPLVASVTFVRKMCTSEFVENHWERLILLGIFAFVIIVSTYMLDLGSDLGGDLY